MTKKDYQAIAAIIYRHRYECEGIMGGSGMLAVVDAVAAGISDYMEKDNPQFNAALFSEACKTGRCRGMKARS